MKTIAIVVSVMCLASCASMPDIDRAVENYHRGDLQQAKQELTPLVKMGIPEAKLRMADVLATEGGSAQWNEAENLYREIASNEPKAAVRLGKLYRRRIAAGETEYFQEATDIYLNAMQQGDMDALRDLIELHLENPQLMGAVASVAEWIDIYRAEDSARADFFTARLIWSLSPDSEGAAKAQTLCKPLQATLFDCVLLLGETYAVLQDAAAQAALVNQVQADYARGRLDAEQVYQLAKHLELSGEYANQNSRELYLTIIEDHPKAVTGYIAQVLRTHSSVDTREIMQTLKQRAEQGDTDATYLLGRLYYKGELLTQDPVIAEQYFLRVADEVVGASLALGIMYRDGYLGDPDFKKALKYLLSAARRGSYLADRMLAEMYWQQKGVKRNDIYAYSFAKFATKKNDEKSWRLFNEISSAVTPVGKAEGDRLYASERVVREQQSQSVVGSLARENQVAKGND